MKIVKRWRYYCDYCNKSGGSKFHMKKHEQCCTMNINRVCGICEYLYGYGGGFNQSGMIEIVLKSIDTYTDRDGKKYKKIADGFTEESVIASLKEITECPACILSALRQTGSACLFEHFDYKEEKKTLWGRLCNNT